MPPATVLVPQLLPTTLIPPPSSSSLIVPPPPSKKNPKSAPDPSSSAVFSLDLPPPLPPQPLPPLVPASGATPAASASFSLPSSVSDLAPLPCPNLDLASSTAPPLPPPNPTSVPCPPTTIPSQKSYAQAVRSARGPGFVRSHADEVEPFARIPRTGAHIICGSREGMPYFSFVSSDLPRVEDIYSNALVMRFQGGRPSLEASHREILSWGMQKQFSIGPLHS